MCLRVTRERYSSVPFLSAQPEEKKKDWFGWIVSKTLNGDFKHTTERDGSSDVIPMDHEQTLILLSCRCVCADHTQNMLFNQQICQRVHLSTAVLEATTNTYLHAINTRLICLQFTLRFGNTHALAPPRFKVASFSSFYLLVRPFTRWLPSNSSSHAVPDRRNILTAHHWSRRPTQSR